MRPESKLLPFRHSFRTGCTSYTLLSELFNTKLRTIIVALPALADNNAGKRKTLPVETLRNIVRLGVLSKRMHSEWKLQSSNTTGDVKTFTYGIPAHNFEKSHIPHTSNLKFTIFTRKIGTKRAPLLFPKTLATN